MQRRTPGEVFLGHFERVAAEYDRQYDEASAEGQFLRVRLEAALRLAGEGPGEALDAGAGSGRLAEGLARRGWTVSGVDASARMLELARTRVPEASTRLLPGRVEALPFADASFDLVTSVGVVDYCDDPGAAIRELARVVRPGGRAVLSVRQRSFCRLWRDLVVYPPARVLKRLAPFGLAPPPRFRPPLRPRELATALAQAGLSVEAAERVGLFLLPDPLDRLFPRLALALAALLEPRAGLLGRALALNLLVLARRD